MSVEGFSEHVVRGTSRPRKASARPARPFAGRIVLPLTWEGSTQVDEPGVSIFDENSIAMPSRTAPETGQ